MTRGFSEQVSLLVVTIVQQEDVRDLTKELVERGYRVTRIDSWGGFLDVGNSVVLIGTGEDRLGDIFDAIRQTCRTRVTLAPAMPAGDPLSGFAWPIEMEVGGAVVFALPVERYVRLTGQVEAELAAASSGARAHR